MMWIALGVLAVCVALALFVMVRRRDGGGRERDLGIISSSWLNERRAHERDVDPNR
jgi:hypothetical protein